jgi:hypothetical protein
VGASGPDGFEQAIRATTEQHADAVLVLPSTFTEYSRRLADLMAKARLPAMFYRPAGAFPSRYASPLPSRRSHRADV